MKNLKAVVLKQLEQDALKTNKFKSIAVVLNPLEQVNFFKNGNNYYNLKPIAAILKPPEQAVYKNKNKNKKLKIQPCNGGLKNAVIG